MYIICWIRSLSPCGDRIQTIGKKLWFYVTLKPPCLCHCEYWSLHSIFLPCTCTSSTYLRSHGATAISIRIIVAFGYDHLGSDYVLFSLSTTQAADCDIRWIHIAQSLLIMLCEIHDYLTYKGREYKKLIKLGVVAVYRR